MILIRIADKVVAKRNQLVIKAITNNLNKI